MLKKRSLVVSENKLLIFDFDGTISATNSIKLAAFSHAAENTGLTAVQKSRFLSLVRHQFGLSDRYEMCQMFADKNPMISSSFTEECCALYADQLNATYHSAPLIPGFKDYIERTRYDQAIIVSGGKKKEILSCLKYHGIDARFAYILDASSSKKFHYRNVSKQLAPHQTVVTFGDTMEDYEGAKLVGGYFYFVAYESATLEDKHKMRYMESADGDPSGKSQLITDYRELLQINRVEQ